MSFVHVQFLAYSSDSAAMSEEDCITYDLVWDIPEDNDGYMTDCGPMDINNILDGTTQLNVSHAGGEFQQIMEEELHQQSR